MSQENVQIVRRLYEEVTARLDVPRELIDSDFELDLTDVAPDIGVLRGTEAALEGWLQYAQTFEDFRVELKEVIHADERQVVTEIRDAGRLKGTDAEVSSRYFHAWTFCNGKVARLSAHTDRARALQAAGLRE
jgi:ketosteroid isomerase-like protein